MLVISYFEFDGVNSFSKLFPAGNVGSISDLIAILRSLMCPRRKAIKFANCDTIKRFLILY